MNFSSSYRRQASQKQALSLTLCCIPHAPGTSEEAQEDNLHIENVEAGGCCMGTAGVC